MSDDELKPEEVFESLKEGPWSLSPKSPDENPKKMDFEEIISAIAYKIAELLEHDHPKLMQIFYRLDVSSEKVDEILKHAPINTIPTELAKVVLRREIEKAQNRRKYRRPE